MSAELSSWLTLLGVIATVVIVGRVAWWWIDARLDTIPEARRSSEHRAWPVTCPECGWRGDPRLSGAHDTGCDGLLWSRARRLTEREVARRAWPWDADREGVMPWTP